MSRNTTDNAALFFATVDDGTVTHRLNLTTTDASLTISAGGYHIVNRGDGDAFVRHGAAAVLPADGASAEGFPLLAGGSVTADLPAGDLHALTFSGTTTLLLVQVR